jgi:hypothetical protein
VWDLFSFGVLGLSGIYGRCLIAQMRITGAFIRRSPVSPLSENQDSALYLLKTIEYLSANKTLGEDA